ncbi:hypothetical protein BKA70DRAFT_1245518 [Coprinopsis sp. MPI-PUGE-AT-0042]|nr:hypothetical protein BKA70DRAFT_1245518 [Coprinopsis sp. MPI-PUGE-AT-0042]
MYCMICCTSCSSFEISMLVLESCSLLPTIILLHFRVFLLGAQIVHDYPVFLGFEGNRSHTRNGTRGRGVVGAMLSWVSLSFFFQDWTVLAVMGSR